MCKGACVELMQSFDFFFRVVLVLSRLLKLPVTLKTVRGIIIKLPQQQQQKTQTAKVYSREVLQKFSIDTPSGPTSGKQENSVVKLFPCSQTFFLICWLVLVLSNVNTFWEEYPHCLLHLAQHFSVNMGHAKSGHFGHER